MLPAVDYILHNEVLDFDPARLAASIFIFEFCGIWLVLYVLLIAVQSETFQVLSNFLHYSSQLDFLQIRQLPFWHESILKDEGRVSDQGFVGRAAVDLDEVVVEFCDDA